MLKNFKSQRYTGLMKLSARRRVLLTGTPIQNNLLELCSILAFATPAIFRDRLADLVRTFSKTNLEMFSNYADMVSKAKRLIAPFVLRRKKADVLTHLPPKTITVVQCPMPQAHAQLYQLLK